MDVFAALAEPTRRQILEILAQQGQLPASAIYEQFEVTPQAISQHLKVLREAKLVSVERQGQQRLYSLVPGGVGELEAWARRTRRQWDGRMDRLERLLAAETERAPRSEGDAEEDG
ncbi:MAG: ArsR/SmtB family transcription factor [Candidatus Promineifilaceae bacterium]